MKSCQKSKIFEHFQLLHNRKAQIQTQVFIYVLSMIVVGLVLLYGYNAIQGFRERQNTVSLIEMENEIRNTITSMSSEYESIKKEELQIPPQYKLICFVDKEELGQNPPECTYGDNIPITSHTDQKVADSNFIIQDSIKDGTANIFLLPDGTANYLIGNIYLDSKGCICIQKQGSQAVFKITGLGNGVKIDTWT